MDSDKLSDFFSFRTLISTSWIKVIYILGVVGISLGSLALLVAVMQTDEPCLGWIAAIAYFILLNVGWRIFCEALILFFSMHEQLVQIAKNTTTYAVPVARTAKAAEVVARAASAAGSPPQPQSLDGVPSSVRGAYERWVAGDAEAYEEFIRDLRASLDILPDRIGGAFLRGMFREAVGTPDFEAIVAKRR